MRTPLRRARIPIRAAAVAFTGVTLLLAGCSDDDDDAGGGSTVSSAVTGATDTGGTSGSSPATATTIPLPPQDTSDIPPPPPGTGDLPVFTPPETSDVPVYLSVTVGVDDSPTRIETVPFGARVTIDVVNLEAADEFHLEGYDLGAGDVMGPGQTYTFGFVANQVGDFSLQSLTSGETLLTLRVG